MYELVFWQYSDGIYLNNHLVYEDILDGKLVVGLEDIPTSIILNRIQNVFADWEKADENSWKNRSGKGGFQTKTNAQSIVINCFGVEGKYLDKLADILEEFKCALYDPQIPIRYDEFNL
jgi:hypothetical protein